MSPAALKAERPTEKPCPICEAKCSISASEWRVWRFTARKEQFLRVECDQLNPIGSSSCQSCGVSFDHKYSISLKEALRYGVIKKRGMDIDETETRHSEKISEFGSSDIHRGDDILVNHHDCPMRRQQGLLRL